MQFNLKPKLFAIAAATLFFAGHVAAEPVKVGLMLPATGTFAELGTMIENGFKLYVAEQGGKLGPGARSSISRSTMSQTRPRPSTMSTS